MTIIGRSEDQKTTQGRFGALAYVHTSSWFHTHSHSQFSVVDGMTTVADLVNKAVKDKRPAQALTDHGNMAGAVQLYKVCKEAGIQPWIGSEWYLLDPVADDQTDSKTKRFHVGIVARDLKGYQGLIKLMNMAHTRPRFSRFPRIMFTDLRKFAKVYGNHVVLFTGCFFGLAQQAYVAGGVDAAKRVVKTYASMFPHTVVEIQNHNIKHDEDSGVTDFDIAMDFVDIANELGLPVMATQDNHYAHQRQKSAHCVVGDTLVTGVGPNNGRSVEWYYNMLHGAHDAVPGRCESCGTDLVSNPGNNVYRTRDKAGALVQIPSGKWYARIRVDGHTYQSPAGHKDDAISWLDVQRKMVIDKWLCKKCYHTRYMFQRNGGTKIVGRDANGMLSLQSMVDVVYNGLRRVLTIETANGKAITSTYNHRHLTADGWKCAKDITVDDELVTYTRTVSRYDRSHRPSKLVRDAVKARAKNKCEHCGSPNTGMHHVAHKDYSSNEAANLLFLCATCHRAYDSDSRATVWTNPVGTKLSRVVSIKKHIKLRHVYDVVMDSDDHSWLGNEIVTHNSLMKRMVYGGVEDEFPGDSFHLASADWVAEHYPQKVWNQVEETSKHLLGLHELSIPPLDKFKAYVPKMVANPNTVLKKRCEQELTSFTKAANLFGSYSAEYWDRLKEELSVIKDLGMADYFLLVLMFVDWCRKREIAIEARGSANGSLVLFLLNITQVDPIKKETLFERFLSRDRTKPPDVDIDIETDRRGEALEWLRQHFVTVQIGTWSELGSTVTDPDRGSVLITYQSWLRRKTEQECIEKSRTKGEGVALAKVVYAQRYGWIRSIDDVRRVSMDDYVGLRQLADMRSVRRSYGVHAGGVLLAGEGLKIDDYIPRMLVASSDTHVTQFDMDDVEQLGFLKLDLLGQKTLTVMRVCQKLIGRTDPCDFTWIPEDDYKACWLLRQGRTNNGIFHFDGWTKSRGGKEMGIRSTADAVLATALYMPGAMDSGQKDHYLLHRQNPGLRTKLKYLHPVYEQALAPTYGAVVFQEQPLQILRALHMSIENINVMFKIVKSSGKGAVQANRERLAKLKDEFERLALKAGIKQEDLAEAWHLVTGFIAYGFNKAHAAGYGIRSYRCAYLKAHHPLEFMASLLMVWAGDPKKEPQYEHETRRMGIEVLPPDVNRSSASWTVDRKREVIRRGLLSIKGVGPKAAEQLASHAPYSSVMDLCTKAKIGGAVKYVDTGGAIVTGVVKALWDAGALNSVLTRRKR